MLRLRPELLALIDAAAAKEGDQPSRPEVIRRLLEKALDTPKRKR